MREIASQDVQIIDYHRVARNGETMLTLVVESEDLEGLEQSLSILSPNDSELVIQKDVASVSVVGSGLACGTRTLAEVERVLADAQIPVYHVGTSSFSITCVIPASARKEAVQMLHMRFVEEGS